MSEIRKTLVVAILAGLVAFFTALLSNMQKNEKVDNRIDAVQAQAEDAKSSADTAKDSAKRVQDDVKQLGAASLGSLADGQKLCRVLQAKTWRDGLIVPQNWSISLCTDYMKKTGGTGYQLGCIHEDGTTLGGMDGTIPSPNCGWR